jgi:small subunit ribosomal protein S17
LEEDMPGLVKTKTGRVVSTKMQKTVVVAVESLKPHPLYKHTLRRTKRFKAHDEHNDCREGDVVKIAETRPLSKEKRWRVVEILRHDEALVVSQQVRADTTTPLDDLAAERAAEGDEDE